LKLLETEETYENVGRESRSLGRESNVIFLKYRALVLSDKNSVTSDAIQQRILSVLTGGLRYYDKRADSIIQCWSDKIMTVYMGILLLLEGPLMISAWHGTNYLS
jgi:hypothetical protein